MVLKWVKDSKISHEFSCIFIYHNPFRKYSTTYIRSYFIDHESHMVHVIMRIILVQSGCFFRSVSYHIESFLYRTLLFGICPKNYFLSKHLENLKAIGYKK